MKIFKSILFAGKCRNKLGNQSKSKYNIGQKLKGRTMKDNAGVWSPCITKNLKPYQRKM